MVITKTSQIIASWVYQETLGFKSVPANEGKEVYAKALLIAAKGDGTLAPAERDWVIGCTAAKGVPESVLEMLKTYEATEDLDKLLSSNSTTDKARRAIIYNAIQACAADGEYSDGEKVAIRKIAVEIQVSEDAVEQIEELYQEEKKLFDKKIKVLYPDGSPY